MKETQQIPVLLESNVIITTREGKAALEIRTSTTDKTIIRALIVAAYHNQPILILPKFSNKLKSMASLCELKVLKYDFETDKYYFLI